MPPHGFLLFPFTVSSALLLLPLAHRHLLLPGETLEHHRSTAPMAEVWASAAASREMRTQGSAVVEAQASVVASREIRTSVSTVVEARASAAVSGEMRRLTTASAATEV